MRNPLFRHAETTTFGVIAAALAGAVVWSAAASAETNETNAGAAAPAVYWKKCGSSIWQQHG